MGQPAYSSADRELHKLRSRACDVVEVRPYGSDHVEIVMSDSRIVAPANESLKARIELDDPRIRVEINLEEVADGEDPFSVRVKSVDSVDGVTYATLDQNGSKTILPLHNDAGSADYIEAQLAARGTNTYRIVDAFTFTKLKPLS